MYIYVDIYMITIRNNPHMYTIEERKEMSIRHHRENTNITPKVYSVIPTIGTKQTRENQIRKGVKAGKIVVRINAQKFWSFQDANRGSSLSLRNVYSP
jgi:hypothetical protein